VVTLSNVSQTFVVCIHCQPYLTDGAVTEQCLIGNSLLTRVAFYLLLPTGYQIATLSSLNNYIYYHFDTDEEAAAT